VRLLVSLALFTGIVVLAQSPNPYDPKADGEDDAIVEEMLRRSWSAQEIYESESMQRFVQTQAAQLIDAARRRVDRQELRYKEARAGVATGDDTPENVQELYADLQKRYREQNMAILRAGVLQDIVETARLERRRYSRGKIMEKYQGSGVFTSVDLTLVAAAYVRKWGRPMPISALGQTSTHRTMGFNHKGRVDVALSPDQPQGVWLRNYLETLGIPYYAFRAAMKGSATAAHIHIGPGSARTHGSD